MNKKAKAQLLSELAQLDVERRVIYIHCKGWYMSDWGWEGLKAFRDKICGVLGIHNVEDPRGESFTTTDPILGGDVGVTTHINYQITEGGSDDTAPPIEIIMAYEGLQVQYTAPTAVDLPVMLHRGYAALRVLRKGTINYHKS